jgi:electron transfer flavoprotein alpha subunit
MSGEIWVIGESSEGQLAASTPGIATLGCEIAAEAGLVPVGVLVGDDVTGTGEALAAYLPRVLAGQLPPHGDWLDPSDAAAVIASLVLARSPAYLLVAGTPSGRALAGCLAARLGWGIITSAQGLSWNDGLVVDTVAFKSETRIRSRFAAEHGIVTVQPNTVRPAALAAPGSVERIAVDGGGERSAVRRVERNRVPAQPSVEAARVVVAGGAGVGSAEAWPVVEQLAAALQGAVGASRPAVDRGWVPLSIQIGQTGKTIRPDLYVALGISGEVQHRVGMRAARTVVAVNLDPDAPIRSHSDLFVVADLHELVPALVAEIGNRTSG